MKKKKVTQIDLKDEKFVIPQINFPLNGIIRGKAKFKRSEVASPFHGTNVVDRKHYIDNSGTVDIDYGYDFIRDEKHISKEELIKIHGTEYYEFTFLDRQLTEEQKRGSDYSKKKSKDYSNEAEENNDVLGDFFEELDTINEPDFEQEDLEDDVDLYDPAASFKIKLSLDDDEPYEHNSYDNNLPKPGKTTIPSYLKTDAETKVINKKAENVTYDEPKKSMFDNFNDTYDIEENKNYEPSMVETYDSDEEDYQTNTNTTNKKSSKYDGYHIPTENIFEQSFAEDLEVPEWLEEKKNIINEQLVAFGIDGEVITYTKGPAFTRYEIMLASNVNVKKVNSISENLQMALKAMSLRILAPIPGKNTVGIEVPNEKADVVKFGDIITNEYLNNNKNLQIAVGKDIDGKPVYQNIIDMPHALIAGATKSGKSVCINTLLVSLLIKNSPEQLKLILVDPKMVELTFYNDLPHLATPVINDPFIATEALKWAVQEMERRYKILAQNRKRNIEDYNRARAMYPNMENLPFIVIVVDEFNDLVMQCSQEANDAIVRLAQKARAAGIHIILATQRPTVNVVSGTIKANITCRFAFKVATDQDSRIILDEQGAETLLGRGDMLIKNNGLPERVQGAYISDDEIIGVCDYICNNYEPDYMFTHSDLKRPSSNGGSKKDLPSEDENFLYEIAKYCIENNTCSVNAIMNNFNTGFNRSSRIVEILAERGIVGEKNGTKGREVLVDSYELNRIFEDLFKE